MPASTRHVGACPHGEGHRLIGESGARAGGAIRRRSPIRQRSLRNPAPRRRRRGRPRCSADWFASITLPRAISSDALPKVISLRVTSSPHAEWLQSTLRLVAAEAQATAAGWRGGDHASGRHPRARDDPLMDRPGSGRTRRLAERASRHADRPGAVADPSRSGAPLDGRLAGQRHRDVPVGIRGAIHRAGRRNR